MFDGYTMSTLKDFTVEQLEDVDWEQLKSLFQNDFIQQGGVSKKGLVS